MAEDERENISVRFGRCLLIEEPRGRPGLATGEGISSPETGTSSAGPARKFDPVPLQMKRR